MSLHLDRGRPGVSEDAEPDRLADHEFDELGRGEIRILHVQATLLMQLPQVFRDCLTSRISPGIDESVKGIAAGSSPEQGLLLIGCSIVNFWVPDESSLPIGRVVLQGRSCLQLVG